MANSRNDSYEKSSPLKSFSSFQQLKVWLPWQLFYQLHPTRMPAFYSGTPSHAWQLPSLQQHWFPCSSTWHIRRGRMTSGWTSLSLNWRSSSKTTGIFPYRLSYAGLVCSCLAGCLSSIQTRCKSDIPKLTLLLNRLSPLVGWAFLLCAQIFWLTGAFSAPDEPADTKTNLEPESKSPDDVPDQGWIKALHYLIVLAALFFIACSAISHYHELPTHMNWNGWRAARWSRLPGCWQGTRYTQNPRSSMYRSSTPPSTCIFSTVHKTIRIWFLCTAGCIPARSNRSTFLIYLMVKSKTGKNLPRFYRSGYLPRLFLIQADGWISPALTAFLILLLLAGW